MAVSVVEHVLDCIGMGYKKKVAKKLVVIVLILLS